MRDLLEALASEAPTPGGGAAAALAGALGAALVAMVARVAARRAPRSAGPASTGRARAISTSQERRRLVRCRVAADRLHRRLLRLAAADALAYARYVTARRRQPAAPGAVERTLVSATAVPLAVAEAARDVLALARALAPRARPATVSDLAVAVHLARGALDAGAVTARANLPLLGAAREARRLDRRVRLAHGRGGTATRQALAALAARRR